MPALEALQDRFSACNTQTFGISIDSVYCHAYWAASLGGVTYPLLSDFNPKGAVADSFGLYLSAAGITDRATVIIDANGVVQHVSSVTPAGKRDIAALAELCEGVDKAYGKPLPGSKKPAGVSGEMLLYVKNGCPFSRAALNARVNLHLESVIKPRFIDEDESALAALEKLTGKKQVPCLVTDGVPMHESGDIVAKLATAVTGF